MKSKGVTILVLSTLLVVGGALARKQPSEIPWFSRKDQWARTEPRTLAEPLFEIPCATLVRILAEQGEWRQVRRPDSEQTGWVGVRTLEQRSAGWSDPRKVPNQKALREITLTRDGLLGNRWFVEEFEKRQRMKLADITPGMAWLDAHPESHPDFQPTPEELDRFRRAGGLESGVGVGP